MSTRVLRLAWFLLAALAVSSVAHGQNFAPVKETQASHLGITVQAPGTDGWMVAEEKYKKGWRILYRMAESTEVSRTSGVFLKSDQYKPGKFVREEGSLEQLAKRVLLETRAPETPNFKEVWAEVNPVEIHGTQAWRIRVAWEERNNPYFPGAEFLMEVSQVLMLHPEDADRIISIACSTRRRLEQEPLSADDLSASFVGGMTFE